jgi:hypothetical protein
MKQDDLMFRIELAHCMYAVCTISKGPASVQVLHTYIIHGNKCRRACMKFLPLLVLSACNLEHDRIMYEEYDRIMYEEWVYCVCEILRGP